MVCLCNHAIYLNNKHGNIYNDILYLLFFGHKLKIHLQERNQNTTTLGDLVQTEGASRDNAHMGPNLSRDH